MTIILLPEMADEMPLSISDIAPQQAHAFVGLCDEALQALSDTDLAQHILHCAEEFIAAHNRHDDAAMKAWWEQEAAALVERGQRPGIVTAMEKRLGLA